MKVAVLSDIHGNDVALDVVLNQAFKLQVERLLVLGDIVGYYYRADKALELLSQWDMVFIQGNHEAMLQQAQDDPLVLAQIKRKYGSGIELALQKLGSDEIEFLTSSASRKTIELDDYSIEISHGTPWDIQEYLYPENLAENREKFASRSANVFFMGHTHYPFISHDKEKIFVNVGSVGQARDQGGLASWVLLDTDSSTFVFHRTPFDFSDLVKEVKSIDPDIPYLHEVLTRGS